MLQENKNINKEKKQGFKTIGTLKQTPKLTQARQSGSHTPNKEVPGNKKLVCLQLGLWVPYPISGFLGDVAELGLQFLLHCFNFFASGPF